MTVYVDTLAHWGMKYRGKTVKSCHMMTDGDIEELHAMAVKLGVRKWFQDKNPRHPHYDLMAGKRAQAVSLGAVSVTPQELLKKCVKTDTAQV